MTDYSVLSVIQTIVTAGQHVLQGVATGTARGTISDDGGLERVVSFHEVVVPGMGVNLFSVTEAMRKCCYHFSSGQTQVGGRRHRSPNDSFRR